MADKMTLTFESKSENERFARVAVSAFVARIDMTLDEMEEIKTAVSEAVTNSIIHGYGKNIDIIKLECEIEENNICIVVEDEGVGIDNVEMAMEPLYTSKPDEERSGMGFTFMEMFMDELRVESKKGEGTKVFMKKKIILGDEG